MLYYCFLLGGGGGGGVDGGIRVYLYRDRKGVLVVVLPTPILGLLVELFEANALKIFPITTTTRRPCKP